VLFEALDPALQAFGERLRGHEHSKKQGGEGDHKTHRLILACDPGKGKAAYQPSR
jgi:hypothetical protein